MIHEQDSDSDSDNQSMSEDEKSNSSEEIIDSENFNHEKIRTLFSAINYSNINGVVHYLKKEKPNVCDGSGWLPLDWLFNISNTRANKTEEVELKILGLLFKDGTNPLLKNDKGTYPLGAAIRYCAKYDKYDLMRKFFEEIKKTNEKVSKIIFSEEDEKHHLISYVIKYCHKNFTDKDIIENFDCNGPINVFQSVFSEKHYFTKKFENMSPIIYALFLKNNFAFTNILSTYPSSINDVDNNNVSVLQYFCRYSSCDIMSWFLEKYKDIKLLTHINNNGETCLHEICRSLNIKVIDLLLNKNIVDINKKNNKGDTPLAVLFRVSFSGEKKAKISFKLVVKLLSFGAKLNVLNSETFSKYLSRINKYIDHDFVGELNNLRNMEILEDRIQAICKKTEKFFLLKNNVVESVSKFIQHNRKNIISKFKKDENTKDKNLYTENLNKIAFEISSMNIVNYDFVNLYQFILNLKSGRYDIKSEITERFQTEYLDVVFKNDDYYYTFLKNKSEKNVYRLCRIDEVDSPDKVIYKLMTTLVYEAQRHSWNEDPSLLHQRLISKLDKKYIDYNLKEYTEELNKIEKENDYFGENISSDSDSEAEKSYLQLPHRKQSLLFSYSNQIRLRSQLKLSESQLKKQAESHSDSQLNQIKYLKSKVGLKEEGSNVKSGPKYKQDFGQNLPKNELMKEKVEKDLARLNALALKGDLNEKTIKTIPTQFYIAQYRGISYRLAEWNKPDRKLHRKTAEESQPLFSKAVLKLANVSYVEHFKKQNDQQAYQKETDRLTVIADNLKTQIQQLLLSGPVNVFFGGKESRFENALYALQQCYSSDYGKFHKILADFSDKYLKTTIAVDLGKIEQAILLSLGSPSSPFVSTSDLPEHALRYAYGDKYYIDYKEERLRPRWRMDGKAERPYSGKVYVSLHTPLELLNASNHVVSLNEKAELNILSYIAYERETSFFSFLPKEKIISQHVAKFPSFNKPYKKIFFEKYGLDKQLYESFSIAIKETKPHTLERKHVIKRLTAHLVHYQEICLIEEAKLAAENRKGILIYQSDFGGFSLNPCEVQENPSNDRKEAIALQWRNRQDLKDKKLSKTVDTDSFFTNVLSKHTMVTPPIVEVAVLLSKLKTFLEIDNNNNEIERKLEKVDLNACILPESLKSNSKNFKKIYSVFEIVASDYKVNFCIYVPRLELDKNPNNEKIILIGKKTDAPKLDFYYAGGDSVIALKSKVNLHNNQMVALKGKEPNKQNNDKLDVKKIKPIETEEVKRFAPAFDKKSESSPQVGVKYMLSAAKIEEKAFNEISKNSDVKNKIELLKGDVSQLFDYFIDNVKKNDYLTVSYVLNISFTSAKERNNFGDRKDKDGNAAYHYAAKYAFNEIVMILNDKREFTPGKKRQCSYTLTNTQDETPLDVCCSAGHLETFKLIWERAGKSTHNPIHCLQYACQGGNAEIVREILEHAKVKRDILKESMLVEQALSGNFGSAIREEFQLLNLNIVEIQNKTKDLKRKQSALICEDDSEDKILEPYEQHVNKYLKLNNSEESLITDEENLNRIQTQHTEELSSKESNKIFQDKNKRKENRFEYDSIVKGYGYILSNIYSMGFGKNFSDMSEEEQVEFAMILSLIEDNQQFNINDNRFINELGLSCQNVLGDGFCLFRAIAKQIVDRKLSSQNSSLSEELPTTMEGILQRVAIFFNKNPEKIMEKIFLSPKREDFGSGEMSDELYQKALTEYKDTSKIQTRFNKFKQDFYKYICLGKYETNGNSINTADWLPQIISDILQVDIDIYDGQRPGAGIRTNTGYGYRIGLGRINNNHYISLDGDLEAAQTAEQQAILKEKNSSLTRIENRQTQITQILESSQSTSLLLPISENKPSPEKKELTNIPKSITFNFEQTKSNPSEEEKKEREDFLKKFQEEREKQQSSFKKQHFV